MVTLSIVKSNLKVRQGSQLKKIETQQIIGYSYTKLCIVMHKIARIQAFFDEIILAEIDLLSPPLSSSFVSACEFCVVGVFRKRISCC